MNTKEILKDIIKIPSFVDSNNNESKLGQWIYEFLKKNSTLNVEKEFLNKNRFNVVATNCSNPEILVSGHIDTVQSKLGWLTDPFVPVEKDGKVFGLGSGDMKAGIAVMLTLACQQTSQKIMYLFYCDEEYDFLGMKKFIEDYGRRIDPKLIISLDGGAGQIGNSCRGLVELTVKVAGRSGHAANPKSGINAISNSNIVIAELHKWLKQFKTPELGMSTLNIAYISGGTNTGNRFLGREGNIIPDYCEYVIEIRVADPRLDAAVVSDFIRNYSEKKGLTIKEIRVRHDLRSWITPIDQLKNMTELSPRSEILNAKNRGYIDIQILWETFDKVPCFTFGIGSKGTAHKENEYVEIDNIIKAEEFYRKLIVNRG